MIICINSDAESLHEIDFLNGIENVYHKTIPFFSFEQFLLKINEYEHLEYLIVDFFAIHDTKECLLKVLSDLPLKYGVKPIIYINNYTDQNDKVKQTIHEIRQSGGCIWTKRQLKDMFYKRKENKAIETVDNSQKTSDNIFKRNIACVLSIVSLVANVTNITMVFVLMKKNIRSKI